MDNMLSGVLLKEEKLKVDLKGRWRRIRYFEEDRDKCC